uniref:Ubiquitin-like domain-containing protein n=1 Tax=Pinguiococcus pyrenoidosus TaxID=172671 RepID=A0A7R9UDS5_9STRA|mmetsp:Transcript_5013/g.20032  ORF Transcript_5013/g.20032 Transcript_5013/m.20032 type:complete len:182 (+) Transcript_5013:79-624(+)|eukprot:scaffold7092_cov262-Pinguiococcus_pyrenoidosus.AAC.19
MAAAEALISVTVVFDGDGSLEVPLHRSEDIQVAKERILQAKAAQKHSVLRIFFHGQELHSGKPLTAYSIEQGDALDAVLETSRDAITGTLEASRPPQYSTSVLVLFLVLAVLLALASLLPRLFPATFVASAAAEGFVNWSSIVFVVAVVLNYTPTYLGFMSIWFFGRKGFKRPEERDKKEK